MCRFQYTTSGPDRSRWRRTKPNCQVLGPVVCKGKKETRWCGIERGNTSGGVLVVLVAAFRISLLTSTCLLLACDLRCVCLCSAIASRRNRPFHACAVLTASLPHTGTVVLGHAAECDAFLGHCLGSCVDVFCGLLEPLHGHV